MDDGAIKLELDQALGARLKAAADEAGDPINDYAARLIEQGLAERWGVAEVRLAEYDRTGEYVLADDAMAAFRTAIADRLRKRG